ncbi:hypothetical protein L6452_43070 [Arctium lappa]|uniref:Uncharacterized protein n=1 Tax=Arctium lappa TaxID=4217 RepID=A0ACB8XK17_ARCLA|nr:hypothetical protein L6452_43070 [Arctium lappa]
MVTNPVTSIFKLCVPTILITKFQNSKTSSKLGIHQLQYSILFFNKDGKPPNLYSILCRSNTFLTEIEGWGFQFFIPSISVAVNKDQEGVRRRIGSKSRRLC